MKRSHVILVSIANCLITVLLLIGCSKSLPTQNSTSSNSTIVGTWNWIKSSGGFTGGTITPASAGYTMKISFGSEGTYQSYRDDTLYASTRYTVRQIDSSQIIHYADSVRFWPQYFELAASDTLYLTDDLVDGYRSLYSRQR